MLKNHRRKSLYGILHYLSCILIYIPNNYIFRPTNLSAFIRYGKTTFQPDNLIFRIKNNLRIQVYFKRLSGFIKSLHNNYLPAYTDLRGRNTHSRISRILNRSK